MKENFGMALELICLMSNIRNEVWWVLNSFFFLFENLMKEKTHNMLVLMLNPKFKNFVYCLFFIGHDQRVTIYNIKKNT
jgi:hypothetical protein